MSTQEQRVREVVLEQAAMWLIENRNGLDSEQRAEFSAWLRLSPLHVEEYLAVAALLRDLPDAAQPRDESVEQLKLRARQEVSSSISWLGPRGGSNELHARRSYIPAVAAGFAAVLAIGLLSLSRSWLPSHALNPSAETGQYFRTGHGEQATYALADQSVMHLNSDTVVSVHFDSKERLVVIESGEADFEVMHDIKRAFRVVGGATQIVDVGTRFDVRLSPAFTLVTVAEGRVRVAPTAQANSARDLSAGQQMRVEPGVWPATAKVIDVDRVMAWLKQKVRFDDEPLAQVASELNRYMATPFEIATPALQTMRISGVFATNDPQAFEAFLRSLPGVRVRATPTRVLVSQD